MCEKCLRIDGQIEHYAALSRTADDRFTEMGVAFLVVDLQAEKARLHPIVLTGRIVASERGP